MSFNMRCESTRTAFFLTETEASCNRAYMFSVHGSNRLGNRTAKSPRAIVQLERTLSEGAFSTTVKRSCRFASLKIQALKSSSIMFRFFMRERERESTRSHQNFASMIINRHKASIPDACSSGY